MSPLLETRFSPSGPYYHGNQGVASTITPFWVVPPPEVSASPPPCHLDSLPSPSKLVRFAALLQQRPNDYGIPVAVEVTYVQDNFLTSDVLNEMVRLPGRRWAVRRDRRSRLRAASLHRCCWWTTTGQRPTSSSSPSTGVPIPPCWTRSR